MHVRSGTTVVSLICANWRDYSWRQLELSPNFHSLPTQNIYKRETGWERLEERRTKRKLQLFYNIQNGSTPPYLLDLIPRRIQSPTIYPLRNGKDIIVPFCRLSLTRDSFVPATVRKWKSLNLSVRNLDTLSKFKRQSAVQSQFQFQNTILMVLEKMNIILIQLRCNASFLNYD